MTLPDGTTGYRGPETSPSTTPETSSRLTVSFWRVESWFRRVRREVSVSTTGVVTAVGPDGAVQQLGNISLTRFTNPGGLLRDRRHHVRGWPGGRRRNNGCAGSSGLGTISQGFLEGSNVELTTELVNLLVAHAVIRV